jgi:PAS domain S-box-containing protein
MHHVQVRTPAEQALLESEARTRAILDAAVDAVITIDHEGRIVEFNPAAERIFGYSRSQAMGSTMAELIVPPRLRGQHSQGLRHFMATGEGPVLGKRIEMPAMRADGGEFPVEIVITAIPGAEPPLFTGFLRDITERKLADEQLRFYAAQLQERNTALTRSNQELDDFAYIASHDLKEPLRGIHNYASFLVEDYRHVLDEEGQAKLETLKTLTKRMDALLDSLLEFSRVGRVDFALKETDLNKVVAGVLDSLRITVQERGLEVRIPRPLPTVRCDHVRVGEVFRNLITNAIKYNDKPHPWIEIGESTGAGLQGPAADSRSGANRTARIMYVRDNGIGIRDQHRENIFRIFKRLHPRDKFGGGTGVGLTIVKKIVERHGGRIWVDSVYGEGTTFYFTLAS